MKIQFTKMHGLGNDFVVIDNRETKLKRIPALAKKLCDRRFGIGADQLLLLEHARTADFKMKIFNADSSEVEMCGNGIRCLGKYIWDNVLGSLQDSFSRKYQSSVNQIAIETMAGILYIQKRGSQFKVDMGEPVLEPSTIPLKTSLIPKNLKNNIVKSYPLKVNGKTFKITCVSMGNPHAVIVVKNVDNAPVESFGPLIQTNKLFPNKTNVEFIQIIDKTNIKMRVWERGAGETMACGTGASAAAVASILLGHTNRKVNVHLPGGKLTIQWSPRDNHIYMTGNAVTVYDGTVEI
jgi:diaminopimelate epimerase